MKKKKHEKLFCLMFKPCYPFWDDSGIVLLSIKYIELFVNHVKVYNQEYNKHPYY